MVHVRDGLVDGSGSLGRLLGEEVRAGRSRRKNSGIRVQSIVIIFRHDSSSTSLSYLTLYITWPQAHKGIEPILHPSRTG